jgi:hypothetical protein
MVYMEDVHAMWRKSTADPCSLAAGYCKLIAPTCEEQDIWEGYLSWQHCDAALAAERRLSLQLADIPLTPVGSRPQSREPCLPHIGIPNQVCYRTFRL